MNPPGDGPATTARRRLVCAPPPGPQRRGSRPLLPRLPHPHGLPASSRARPTPARTSRWAGSSWRRRIRPFMGGARHRPPATHPDCCSASPSAPSPTASRGGPCSPCPAIAPDHRGPRHIRAVLAGRHAPLGAAGVQRRPRHRMDGRAGAPAEHGLRHRRPAGHGQRAGPHQPRAAARRGAGRHRRRRRARRDRPRRDLRRHRRRPRRDRRLGPPHRRRGPVGEDRAGVRGAEPPGLPAGAGAPTAPSPCWCC